MGNETIMLAKTYKSHKDLKFPIQITEKLDGVAADFYGENKMDGGLMCFARSRQDDPILSVQHIRNVLKGKLPHGHHLIGELYIPGKDFKYISGLVRRKEGSAATAELQLYVYDYYIEGAEHMHYSDRLQVAMDTLGDVIFGPASPIHPMLGVIATDTDKFDDIVKRFKEGNPNAEGLVYRQITGPGSVYKSGWRSPGMLKDKLIETIDLPIVSIDEAVEGDTGAPKGMVGRINVEYNGAVIGVGPGKMTHNDRIDVFKNKKAFIGKMIEIAYMPDDSYDALREPRFWRFRPDKD